MLKFFNKNTDYKLPSVQPVKRWISEIIADYGCKEGRLSVIFTDDPTLLQMNRDYIGHDYFTDIITFDLSGYPGYPTEAITGELYISVDTVACNAREYGVSDLTEMYRVIVHGVLHLIGLDDHTEDEIAEMRQAEDKALMKLKAYGVEF